MGSIAHGRGTQRFHLFSVAFALLLALALALAACGGAGAEQPYKAPARWQDITPPTSDPIASYAVSPDVPGLIVACMGNREGNATDSPMGVGTIWRSRDGGAHWQRLSVSGYTAGCEVDFPAGGHGALIAYNLDGSQFIQVSHDAGDTWKTIISSNGADLHEQYTFITSGVYRDGLLYTIRARNVSDENDWVFSVSRDDGGSWVTVEATTDPLLKAGYAPLALAADYSTPIGWFRLLGKVLSATSYSQTVLEHSIDGGLTWMQVSKFGEQGGYSGIGGFGSGSATLVTEPGHPLRLCAVVSPIEYNQNAAAARTARRSGAAKIAFLGPPAPIPHDVEFATSSDDGLTWNAAIIVKHRNDYGDAVYPGVAMDPAGACYLADSSVQFGDTAQDVTTIWRVPPSAGASPTAIMRITGQEVSMFAIGLDSVSRAPRFVVAAYTYNGPTVIVCNGNSCPPEPPIPQTHLIRQAAP